MCGPRESYEIAVKIAYENGNLRGNPKGQARDCREVPDVNLYLARISPRAKLIADRRVFLAGYRMARFAGTPYGRMKYHPPHESNLIQLL